MAKSILGIIPSRYGSTRFPGKPLTLIKGKPMIQRVYERASGAGCLTDLYVATDDDRIANLVTSFGGKVVMTSGEHTNGTERCNEALSLISGLTGKSWDNVINIQGDEPFLHPEQVCQVANLLLKPVGLATLVKKIKSEDELFNPNSVKAILNRDNDLIYFSRHPIPYYVGEKQENWMNLNTYYKHIGIYGYSAELLRYIASLKPSMLEISESLEQLRWLYNGLTIKADITMFESISIDTPADLSKIVNIED